MTVAVATRPFWDLSQHGTSPALVTPDGATVGYDELAGRVARLAGRLGPARRLVLLEAGNDVDTVVGYLACLTGGHPVLLTSPGAGGLVAAYDPDVVIGGTHPGGLLVRRAGSRHELHPDLALLLSTSGSTGSPKLVRLSRDNVAANAESIVAALDIRSSDVAATTLPLHYSYGLSVLTSHLAAGASVLLTSASVLDPAFWGDVRRHRVSTFPGVPHTFELLDRAGFLDAATDVPPSTADPLVGSPSGDLGATATLAPSVGAHCSTLRYLTCAGGRLPAATARRFAELGRRRGFDLVLMYGATEATARMAVLPADRALTHPELLGDPVPGGSFTLSPPRGTQESRTRPDATAPDGVGELVYSGDNVMLGYAESPADLARGRDVTELRTGDLARRTPSGLEIVGRVGRHVKVFGLRIDLDRVEAGLRAAGVLGYAAAVADHVVVAVDRTAGPVDHDHVLAVAEAVGLPASGCRVRELDGVPRLASGKVDYRAIAAGPGRAASSPRSSGATAREVLADVGSGPVLDTDSFVTRGGDSLSYVETSLRLERAVGHLPVRWHLMTVADLEAVVRRRTPAEGGAATATVSRGDTARSAWRGRRTVETNVLLRAAAIVMIVGSHSNLFTLLGGAHLLVGLVGFNLARFHLVDRDRVARVRGIATSVARVAIPSMLWLSFAALTSAKYDGRNVVLLNGVLGTRAWSEAWHYWFIEALVWTLLAVAALLAVPSVHRLERRWPFWFPVALAVLGLLTRYDVVRLFGGDYIHRAHVIFWLFALGWATAQATRHRHRLVVSALVAVTVPGFFPGQPEREALVVAGFLLLVWLPSVRVPAALARVAGTLASASLFIYLCHWQIYPAYEFSLPWLATGLSLLAGIVLWQVVARSTPTVSRVARRTLAEIPERRRRLSLRRCLTRDRTPTPQPGVVD